MANEKFNCRSGKSRSEKIFSITTSVLLAVAVLFCGFVMFQIHRDGYVTVFGCSVFHVVSGSMEPEIATGALIVSKDTDIEDIEVGDIISFRSLESYMHGSVVTHRVVDIREKDGGVAFVTKGDANNSVDGYYVTQENYIGRIIYHTPDGNFVTSLYGFLTDKFGFFVVIVVPVVLLTVIILQDNIRRIKKEIDSIKRQIEEEEAENDSDIDE